VAIVVISDPLDTEANSYVSVAEVLAYLTDRVSNDAFRVAWDRLADDQKNRYVVNATRSLDTMATWIGERYWYKQLLDWPRSNAWYDGFLIDSNEVPTRIKEATIEFIMWQMENDDAVSTGENTQFDKIKVGPIEIDFNEQVGGSPKKYFPDIIAYLLEGYGSLNNPDLPGANRLKQVKLFRA